MRLLDGSLWLSLFPLADEKKNETDLTTTWIPLCCLRRSLLSSSSSLWKAVLSSSLLFSLSLCLNLLCFSEKLQLMKKEERSERVVVVKRERERERDGPFFWPDEEN